MKFEHDHGARRRIVPLARKTGSGRAQILIVLRDSSGTVQRSETVEVVRPNDPARQHEQLVRAVTDRYDDARVYRSAPGAVGFACRSALITASYLDDQAEPPPGPPRGKFRSPPARKSIAPPGSDESVRAA